jgi:hypothetical protein
MVRISVIAAVGAAIFLSGCQQDTLAPATEGDRAIVSAQAMGDLMDGFMNSPKGGSMTLYPPLSDSKSDEPRDLPNLLRVDLRFQGQAVQVRTRQPLDSPKHIYYAASISGGGLSGEVFGFAAKDGAPFRPTNFVTLLERKKAGRPALGGALPVSLFRRAEGRVRYGFYQNAASECMTFAQEDPSAFLGGDVCSSAGFKIGKARAEAIIRGIGLDPYIATEAVPDLSTLAVD